GVVVGEQDYRWAAGAPQRRRKIEARAERDPVAQSPFGRPLVHRTVRDRIGERHADLHDVRAATRHGLDRGAAPPQIGVAGGEVRDESAALLVARRGERPGDPAILSAPSEAHGAPTSLPSRRATSTTSLSPRPDRLTITSDPIPPPPPSRSRYARACDDSRAGMIPSRPARAWNAASASSSDA